MLDCSNIMLALFSQSISVFNYILPDKNITAVAVMTNGQILKGITGVLAPVKAVNIATTMSIKADSLYTITDTGSSEPPNTVTDTTSRPIKIIVNPSAIHSCTRIHLLSSEIGPKPLMTDLVTAI